MEDEENRAKSSKTARKTVEQDLKRVVTEYLDQAFWLGYTLREPVNRLGSSKDAKQLNKTSRAIAEAIIEDMEYAYPELRNLWAMAMEEAEYEHRKENAMETQDGQSLIKSEQTQNEPHSSTPVPPASESLTTDGPAPGKVGSQQGTHIAKPNEQSHAAEINTLYNQLAEHASGAISAAMRIGELLSQRKAQLRSDQWLPWMESVNFDETMARNYMHAFHGGDDFDLLVSDYFAVSCSCVCGSSYKRPDVSDDDPLW